MLKIKVKYNPEDVPVEVIRKYKNFDRFMDRYRKYYTPSGIKYMLYKDRKKLVYLVIILLLILMYFLSLDNAEGADMLINP
ncbi:MAG: hypothetical protein OEY34_02740 [Cyclobacteriaceae bacterium]|nr:hypothetical protein [Cyclobacteriaceae bacterium]